MILVINLKAKESMLNTVDSLGKHIGPVSGLDWIKVTFLPLNDKSCLILKFSVSEGETKSKKF